MEARNRQCRNDKARTGKSPGTEAVMANRITGLNSGMDTEALVTSLVNSYQKKVDTLQGNQKRHAWKQDAWKELNKKTVAFYNGKINNMTMTSDFMKKVTTSTNSSAVTILTSDKAMNATQKLSIKKTASSAFATGKALKGKTENDKVTGSTKLEDLNGGLSTNKYVVKETYMEDVKDPVTGETVYKRDPETNEVLLDENSQPIPEQVEATRDVEKTGFSFTVKANGTEKELTFGADATVNDVVNALKSLDLGGQKFNANFDENQGRIYMAAATTGAKGSFEFTGNTALIEALGFKAGDATVYKGEDAEILLNGQEYTSATGTFEINGLTITANEVAEDITITTKQDSSGIYDMIKGMLKDYNELIKEMDTNYYSDPARKYQMLTDDEKEAMSDKEVEEWEKHIKEGLLSKDSTLYDVIQSLKGVMSKGYEVNGKTMYMSDFGIATGSYLSTDQNERGMYHIDGDSDDVVTASNEDKLKAMIASDPEAVSSFFTQIAKGLRSALFDKMRTTEFSSSFTIYEDKLMASQYSDYTSKITTATDRLNKKQDAYYAKFTRMETAMAKVNSVQSNLTGYFGG